MQVVDHPSQVVRRTEKHIGWEVNDSLPRLSRNDVTRRLMAARNTEEDMIRKVPALGTEEPDLQRSQVFGATRASWRLLGHCRRSR
jgi:hypothetical protein